MSRVAWGILGCARISRSGLIPGIRESQLGRLAALASRELAKARAWAAEWDIAKAYGSYEQLMADPEIEAIYIPLPNDLHKPWTLAAAAAGKHVLCDKPLALNAAEAAEMVETCRRHGVLLMEGFMWRHHPRTGRLMELLHDGAIGPLRQIGYSFSLEMNPSDWRLDPVYGGGALRDLGCYGVNTARLVTGAEPEAVEALAHFGPTGVDLTTVAALRFPGDVLVQMDCSFELPFRYRVEVVGGNGSLIVTRDSLSGDPPQLALRRGDHTEAIAIPPGNQFALMVDHFSRSVLAGEPLKPPTEDGLANMQVLDDIVAAAQRHRLGR